MPDLLRFAKLADMSMEFIRSKRNSYFTVLIFGLIILSFVLWGGFKKESESTTVLTTVNGEEIPYEEYRRALGNQLEMYGQMFGGSQKLNDNMIQMVERQVASALVMKKALGQECRSIGLHVGDDEVLDVIKKNAAFQDAKLKRFSPTLYQAVLEANNFKPAAFERLIREDLASERMRSLLEEALIVTPHEIADEYRLDQTEISLEVAVLDPVKLAEKGKINISAAAISDLYKKRQAELLSSERRVAVVASLDTTAWAQKIQIPEQDVEAFYNNEVKNAKDDLWSQPQAHALHILVSDSSRVGQQKALSLMKGINTEAAFREVARKHSEDFSNASQGGDLGYFNEKTMVKPFAEAVFGKTSKLNALTGPVKTDFGWHLIWVLDRAVGTDLESRKRQILYSLRAKKTSDAVGKLKAELTEKLTNKSADPTAYLTEKGFQISETPAFDSKTRLDHLPYPLVQQALKTKKDEWSSPEEFQKNLYVFKITKTLPAEPMTEAEARPLLIKRLESEAVEKLAKSLSDDLRSGKLAWNQLAKFGAETKTHKNMKLFKTTQIPDFGEAEPLVKAVQALRKNANLSAPLTFDGKWILFRAQDWKEPSGDLSATERSRLRESISSKRRAAVLDKYTETLVKNAKIPSDFRKKYNL